MYKKFLGVLILIFLLFFSGNAYAEGFKLGYVNMRKVFFEYKRTKESNKELERDDEKIKKEIEARAQDIRKLRDEIDLLSEKAKERKQPELKNKLKELDEFRKNKVETFIRKKDEMFKEIRDNIMTAAEAYAKKNGYDVLFDEAILIYSTEKYNITDDIIKELNK